MAPLLVSIISSLVSVGVQKAMQEDPMSNPTMPDTGELDFSQLVQMQQKSQESELEKLQLQNRLPKSLY